MRPASSHAFAAETFTGPQWGWHSASELSESAVAIDVCDERRLACDGRLWAGQEMEATAAKV